MGLCYCWEVVKDILKQKMNVGQKVKLSPYLLWMIKEMANLVAFQAKFQSSFDLFKNLF